jgi:predicted nucleic acid-binding protein
VIVLDASALVDLLLGIEPQASALRERVLAPGESLHSPALIDAEVVHAIRRRLSRNVLTAVRAREALDDLLDLRLTRYPLPPLVDRMWELRENLSAYDAAYISLGEALAAPVVTCDRKLEEAAGHRARVETYP